jgi:hemerythrin-like domain-containing protein
MLGRLYSSILRARMYKEEQNLFILAEQLLNDDDWNKIKSETQSKPDPIFGEAIEALFHLVCDHLAQSTSDK